MENGVAGARLFIFDMDGTLISGSTGLLELAKLFKSESELSRMEELYSSRTLSTREFTEAVGQLWGEIPLADGQRAFASAPKIGGIAECLATIKANGHISCLITMSQDVFAQHFRIYGFDYIASTTYPPNTRGPITILEPEDKRRISREICAAHRLDYSRSVAFGDSLSDEPLFSDLTETVAVNATPSLQRISKYNYSGDSILEAYSLLKI
jgi:phosphoserine phosphatase